MYLLKHLLSFLLFFVPLVVVAQPKDFSDFAGTLVRYINGITAVLVTFAIAVYFWGLATNVGKTDEDSLQKFRRHLTWGLATIFVIFAFWGIINLLKSSIFP